MLAAGVLIALAVLLLPTAVAGGFGRLMGDLWVTVMSAVVGLVGSMFGR